MFLTVIAALQDGHCNTKLGVALVLADFGVLGLLSVFNIGTSNTSLIIVKGIINNKHFLRKFACAKGFVGEYHYRL